MPTRAEVDELIRRYKGLEGFPTDGTVWIFPEADEAVVLVEVMPGCPASPSLADFYRPVMFNPSVDFPYTTYFFAGTPEELKRAVQGSPEFARAVVNGVVVDDTPVVQELVALSKRTPPPSRSEVVDYAHCWVAASDGDVEGILWIHPEDPTGVHLLGVYPGDGYAGEDVEAEMEFLPTDGFPYRHHHSGGSIGALEQRVLESFEFARMVADSDVVAVSATTSGLVELAKAVTMRSTLGNQSDLPPSRPKFFVADLRSKEYGTPTFVVRPTWGEIRAVAVDYWLRNGGRYEEGASDPFLAGVDLDPEVSYTEELEFLYVSHAWGQGVTVRVQAAADYSEVAPA